MKSNFSGSILLFLLLINFSRASGARKSKSLSLSEDRSAQFGLKVPFLVVHENGRSSIAEEIIEINEKIKKTKNPESKRHKTAKAKLPKQRFKEDSIGDILYPERRQELNNVKPPVTYRPPRVTSPLPISDADSDWVNFGRRPQGLKNRPNRY